MNEENLKNGSAHSASSGQADPSQGESTDNSNPQVSELDSLKSERDEYLNGWKRAKADLINYQKEEARRVEEAVKFGNESILKEILRVLDNFALALVALEKIGEVDEGLKMIMSQMEDLLKKNGVEPINVTPGDELDPNYHEAIALVPPVDGMKSGTIAEEVERGYTIHGKVLRPSKVKVVE